MKRSTSKVTYATDATCLHCHGDLDYDFGVKSNTWWKGTIGVRAILCSEECREAFDIENLSHVHDMMEQEDNA